MSGLKRFLTHLLAEYRFSRVSAELDVGADAQIRTLALHPKKQSIFRLGPKSIFSGRLSIDRECAAVSIGTRTYFGRSHIVAAQNIQIGSDVLVSWGVTIVDHHSHSLVFEERKQDVVNWLGGTKDWGHVSIAPVRISDKVWIGFGATVMPGVTVGEGAIVAACSVVTKDVEPWTVVGGNPARLIRRLDGAAGSDPIARQAAMVVAPISAEGPTSGV